MKKPRKREPAMAPRHKVFALLWLSNGGNATQAYNEAFGPGNRKPESTHVNASKLLSSTKVQAFIQERGARTLALVEATAEEAMQTITRALRLDPRMLLDKNPTSPGFGLPLKMKDWPDDVALVVKKIKANGDVEFYDKMRAAELIAESHGKIKKKLDITLAFDHVKYLADKSRPK